MTVYGTVAPGFESVRSGFEEGQAIDIGGAQLAVYQNGTKVVDIWTGHDPIRDRPFDGNGVSIMMSVTKALTATVAHLLIERGLLDLDEPVCKYWPEFAQNGKEKITLRMLLAHTSGCPAFPVESGITPRDYSDWMKVISGLEQMTPYWEPGTRVLYAPYTFGFLVGEVIRRVTGKTVGTVLHDEVAGPLGLNLWIGLPEEKEPIVIPTLPEPPRQASNNTSEEKPAGDTSANPARDLPNPLVAAYTASFGGPETPGFMNTREAHAAEIPSANGIGDARSLAKFYAHLIGTVDGTPPLLKAETLKRATTPQTDGIPWASPYDLLVPPGTFRWALGYEKKGLGGQPMLGESSFGHVGSGGRLGFADLDSGLTVGYICNNPSWDYGTRDPRWMPWMEALQRIAEQGAA